MKTPPAFASPILVGLTLVLSGMVASADASPLRTVALSGTVAPGTSSENSFAGFGTPVLNNAGRTAFRGGLTGPGADGGSGIWSEGGSSGLALVARSRNTAPGTSSGVNFSLTLFSPVLNDAGQAMFIGFLSGTEVDFTNDRGIWSEGGGSGLALVAREGNTAPGTSSGVNFTGFSFLAFPAFNNAGQTAFAASLFGTGVDDSNNGGIWSEGGGSGLALVARRGNAAPGTTSGVIFSNFSTPVLNNAGQNAFLGGLTGPGGIGGFGIWSEGGGSGLALVTRSGNAAPGTSSGVVFSSFDNRLKLNGAGQTAFLGDLTGTGVDDSNNLGIWSEGGGSGLALVARSGNAAPGASSGVSFSDFRAPVLNSAGQTAFLGFLTGNGVSVSNERGIWSEGGGSGLSLVVRSGNVAPGTSSGVNFSGFVFPVLNGAGKTAFFGILTGMGVDDTNNRGNWAEDRSGDLTLITREGDLLDVDDGPGTDFRTIGSLNFGGFNDLGQLAFSATFTDGSQGVFVSNLVAVPEPTSWVLAAAGLFVLGITPHRGK